MLLTAVLTTAVLNELLLDVTILLRHIHLYVSIHSNVITDADGSHKPNSVKEHMRIAQDVLCRVNAHGYKQASLACSQLGVVESVDQDLVIQYIALRLLQVNSSLLQDQRTRTQSRLYSRNSQEYLHAS